MKQDLIASYLLPRIRDILFLIIFAVAMAAGWRSLNTDGDLSRHLLMGKVIMESRAIPKHEIFSHIYEGRPYVVHEWLADVMYYLAYRGLGLGGVVLLTAVLIATSFFVLYAALSQDHEERFLMLFLFLWGVACTYTRWIARPHLFTLLFLAIWLVLVDRVSRGKKIALWVLPGLMLLWANIHVEFVAGFLVLIAYIAGWLWDYFFDRQNAAHDVMKRLSAIFILAFAASLINPFGLRLWSMILSAVGNPAFLSTINELRAPDFSNSTFFVEFTLIIASLVILALNKGSIRSGHGFLIAGFTALAMTAGRNIDLYGIVAPFVLAGPVAAITNSVLQNRITVAITHIERQLKGFVWPVAVVFIYFILLVSGRIGKDYFLDPQIFPVDAVQWLEDNPQSGQMFNDFLWGGYIVWNLWPEQRNFIDGQTDVKGEANETYRAVHELNKGWQGILDRYDVMWVIIRVDAPLRGELLKNGWRILYQDSTAVILRRP